MLPWRKMLAFCSLVGLSAGLLALPLSRGEGKTDNQVLIIATSSNRGEVSPCG